MTDYNVVSEREAHFYQGLVAGMLVGALIAFWIVYGGV
jgi:hypothetical protein